MQNIASWRADVYEGPALSCQDCAKYPLGLGQYWTVEMEVV